MTQSQYLLAIDQGTTSSRAILFDQAGSIKAVQQKELELIYPEPGWVEQRPADIWQDTLQACRGIYQQYPDLLASTLAIGITNQRETTILWDRKTGEPVYNAIVWQDRRTAKQCEAMRQQGLEPLVSEKTGLLLDPYFSASKIAWILDNVDGARRKAEAGQLAFGTVDSYLLWQLTGGKVHATDATNAARTSLFNLRTQAWDDELLEIFNVPASLLPDVRDNVGNFGHSEESLLGRSIEIGAMAGDQHAALVGQACFNEGNIKSTYGTGCFLLMNVGENQVQSRHRLLTTMAYRLNGQPSYALEGSIFVAGAAVQWLRDGMGFFSDASETEALARSVADSQGVYFVPALTGLGAPHWKPDARGVISGLGRDTTTAHIVRATLEAQAYQTQDLVEAMAFDVGYKPSLIRADGGLVANAFVCQFLADILAIDIEIPEITEATAWGAASLAGLHSGLYSGLDDIADVWQRKHYYQPEMPETVAQALYDGWRQALGKLL